LNDSRPAEIFRLNDVADVGKALLHTAAQCCDNHGPFSSSFFFDHNIPGRCSPPKPFSTITHDIVRLDDNLATYFSLILQNDHSLASACQTRQFDKLIPKMAGNHSFERPVVIVIDALHEGYDLETLEILCNKVPKLLGTFRGFVTSRSQHDIVTDLLIADQVHQ
jgi:hypothetical protein